MTCCQGFCLISAFSIDSASFIPLVFNNQMACNMDCQTGTFSCDLMTNFVFRPDNDHFPGCPGINYEEFNFCQMFLALCGPEYSCACLALICRTSLTGNVVGSVKWCFLSMLFGFWKCVVASAFQAIYKLPGELFGVQVAARSAPSCPDHASCFQRCSEHYSLGVAAPGCVPWSCEQCSFAGWIVEIKGYTSRRLVPLQAMVRVLRKCDWLEW